MAPHIHQKSVGGSALLRRIKRLMGIVRYLVLAAGTVLQLGLNSKTGTVWATASTIVLGITLIWQWCIYHYVGHLNSWRLVPQRECVLQVFCFDLAIYIHCVLQQKCDLMRLFLYIVTDLKGLCGHYVTFHCITLFRPPTNRPLCIIGIFRNIAPKNEVILQKTSCLKQQGPELSYLVYNSL